MNSARHQQLMSILADAMECDTGERVDLLRRSCAGDESLREDVERLLRSSKSALSFMEEPLIGPAASSWSAQEGELIGGSIGPYRVTDEIGRGGMGAVYLATRNDDEYQRQVAIKLIKRGMDTDLIVRRFRNERQILANLNHQNIARLFDGGTTEDGRPYLVMEYVEGRSIHHYANDHKLSITDRLNLFLSVCNAVDYAHSNQVIHRDLKPGNILVTNEGIPKLLDFGIAKLVYANESTDTTLTVLRGMTPEYASPEQLRGESLTAASDIYSLGVLLYELLTGQRPYNLSQASPYEIAQRVCEIEPAKPSTIVTRTNDHSRNHGGKSQRLTTQDLSHTREGEPEQLRRRLSGDLDVIILRALRKEPEARYASVAQFAEDIRRHLDGLPILARKGARAYRAVKFFKRNRASLVTIALVAVLFLALGISLTLFTTRARARRSIAVMPFVNINQDPATEYLSDGLTDSLINRLSRFPTLVVPAHSSVFRYKGKSANAQAIGRELGVESVLTGRVNQDADRLMIEVTMLDTKSNEAIWTQQYQGQSFQLQAIQQEVITDLVWRLGLATPAEERFPKRNTNDDEAYRLYLRGNYFWNRRSYEGITKAIEYYQQAIDRDPNYAVAYDGLAKSYGLIGAYFMPWPENPYPKAKAAALRALELDPDLAEAHTSLALVTWLYDWDWEAADREFRRALNLDPGYVTGHQWYGLYLGEMGRADESIAHERRALELDPVSLPVHASVGRVYFWARRYDEALQYYTKAREMEPTFGAFYAELRYVYEQKQMYAEWFGALDQPLDVSDVNKQGLLSQYWKEFARINARGGAPHDRAENYARADDKNNAFAQLELAYENHDHRMSQLRVNPIWDPLRSDPRFVELLRRMKLSQ